MDKLKIGILCPSEIAFRRFLPALQKCSDLFEYAGVAVADKSEWFGDTPDDDVWFAEKEKATRFREIYGGEIFSGYKALIADDVACVYIPTPPALHYKWAKVALEAGKHVFVEKPCTTDFADTRTLLNMAKAKSLAVHENYMFQYHSQIEAIKSAIDIGTIGDVRLLRMDFGFPFRGANDFRYGKVLGGGALLDCGGYTVKLASMLLGNNPRIAQMSLTGKEGFDVDIFGNATMVDDNGLTAQISFGMDNSYRCSLDIWGSKGSIYTNRIFTAHDGFEPTLQITTPDGTTEKKLPADNTFKKSIEFFFECINSDLCREKNHGNILRQAGLVETFKQCLQNINPLFRD